MAEWDSYQAEMRGVDAAVERDRDQAASLTEPCQYHRCVRTAVVECAICCRLFCEKHLDEHNCAADDQGTRLEE